MLTNLYEDCKVSFLYYHIRPDKCTVSMTSGRYLAEGLWEDCYVNESL